MPLNNKPDPDFFLRKDRELNLTQRSQDLLLLDRFYARAQREYDEVMRRDRIARHVTAIIYCLGGLTALALFLFAAWLHVMP